ncbi:lantibiotic dehydratase C-terminal domain-containing protein [Sphaerisporangium corydalis]|uniref:Lantibiotic dehydratase C-terminal domain-containing protein n=1 Tax=Sphaerisporangium corydalis TaxID=1441875 RepID=A0ABV9E880_9ACTN|nr:lantibiotic dehydratase C-terminal domain-containing protein [Sphaerisporangium corydalis]
MPERTAPSDSAPSEVAPSEVAASEVAPSEVNPSDSAPAAPAESAALAESAAHESAWVSAHVFYQGDLDPLITGVVAPLVAELDAAGLAREFFFLRYWDGGPHLRLRVLPATDGAADAADASGVTDRRTGGVRAEVERLVAERFGDHLARYPSAGHPDPEEYARMARSLAEREHLTSYSERPHPPNSVSFIPYRREHDRYGHGPAIEAVERHFAESSRIALRVVTLGVPADRRATAAGALILLTWFIGEPDPGRLASWTGDLGPGGRASWTGGRRRAPDGDDARRDKVTGLARRMRALAAVQDPPPGGTLADWARSARTLRDTLTALAAEGAFVPPSRGWEGRGGIATPGGGVPTVLDICAHLICNRFGLSIVTEAALRRLAAEAVAVLAEEGG